MQVSTKQHSFNLVNAINEIRIGSLIQDYQLLVEKLG